MSLSENKNMSLSEVFQTQKEKRKKNIRKEEKKTKILKQKQNTTTTKN